MPSFLCSPLFPLLFAQGERAFHSTGSPVPPVPPINKESIEVGVRRSSAAPTVRDGHATRTVRRVQVVYGICLERGNSGNRGNKCLKNRQFLSMLQKTTGKITKKNPLEKPLRKTRGKTPRKNPQEKPLRKTPRKNPIEKTP